MLKLKNLSAGYVKDSPVLKSIELEIRKSEVVTLIGHNGSGKSTLAKSIMNLIPVIEGEIIFENISLSGRQPYEIARSGIGFFHQGGQIFGSLTLFENLKLAGYYLPNDLFVKKIEQLREIFSLFHNKDWEKRNAASLSYGEKHLMALSMILITDPKLIILDEPSAGLAHENIEKLYDSLVKLKTTGSTILLIEQNILPAIRFSDRTVLLDRGRISKQCMSRELESKESLINFISD